MADVGDLTATVHHRNGEIFDVLEDIVARAVESEMLPVVLGGDHSLSLDVTRGAANAATEIGFLQFDAHDDLAPSAPTDWRAECHHGNFMSWVLDDPRVKRVVQIGLRQRTMEHPFQDERVFALPGKSAETLTDAEFLELLPEDLNWHVSFDVDALDPSELRSTGTPLPGGLSREALSRLMELVCGQRRVVALDVTELIPDPYSDVDALLVADILLLAIAAQAGKA
jgi:arginase family enzyme